MHAKKKEKEKKRGIGYKEVAKAFSLVVLWSSIWIGVASWGMHQS